MNLKDMTLEELKTLSYTDITYMILKEEKTSLNTAKIFKEICNLLNYSDADYADKIGDYYTSLTTDCRFIFLENAEWDLRERHIVKIVIDDDDEEIEVDDESEEEEKEEEIELDSEDAEDFENDLDDLEIIGEDEIEEN